MIIGIQHHPDGPRRELTLEIGGHFGYLVKLDPRDRFPHDINEHTFAWLLGRWHEQTGQPSDPRHYCEQEFRWQCPTWPYQPCRFLGPYKTEQRRACVIIQSSPYEPVLVPVGQMSLFEPHLTHRRMWRHLFILGAPLVDSSEQPFVSEQIVCKRMAVAALLAIQHGKRTFDAPPADPRRKWRIKPLTDYRVDRQWLSEQQERYAGRVKACIFETI